MWHYTINGAQRGPVSRDEIAALIREGVVGGDALVWTDGMGEWLPAARTELAADFTQAASPVARPLRPLWAWLRVLLTAYLVASLASALAMFVQIGVLERIQTGDFSSDAEMARAANVSDTFGVATIAALILIMLWCAFLWARLTYRAMRNLHETGAKGVTISPVGTFGWYFVPLANLWKPLEAMREIWKSSVDPRNPLLVVVPAQVGFWWGLRIFAGVISGVAAISARVDFDSVGDIDTLQTASALYLGVYLLNVPIVLLAKWFLKRIVEQQDSTLLVAAPEPAATPG